MKDLPCLCDGRSGIRCDETHCDLAGPGKPGDANQCRVCWLRLGSVERPSARRSLPCLYLGAVKDQLKCPCPQHWLRACELHAECTLRQCKVCPDYEEGI